MGNYSKNPQTALQEAVQKGYSRVRFQQGKPILDRELNLAADLASANRFLQQYVGSGVPEGSNGFEILNPNPFTQDFIIKAGRCVVNGLEAVLATDTTYQTQPHREHLVQWPAGSSAVYLRVFTVEVNETQDADLKNAGDIGFETALRERVDWEVLILSTSFSAPADHFLLGTLTFTPGSGLPPPPSDTSSTSVSSTKTTTSSSTISSGGGSLPPPTDDENSPKASVTDLRLKGLTLKKVRADLDLLMNPARTALKDASVTNAKIQDAAVTAQKIQDGAVVGTKFLDGSITAQKIQDGAIISQKIMDGNVSNTKITDGAVTAPKIQDGAVTAQKIPDNSISGAKLQNGAINSNKLAASAVGLTNLNLFSLANTIVNLAPSASTTVTVAPKAFIPNTFILVNIFGDGDFSWSERMVKGDRVVTITNQSTVTVAITVKAVMFAG